MGTVVTRTRLSLVFYVHCPSCVHFKIVILYRLIARSTKWLLFRGYSGKYSVGIAHHPIACYMIHLLLLCYLIKLIAPAIKLSTWSCLEIRMQDEFTV